MANRPSRLVLSVPNRWPDGSFRSRWPLGPTAIQAAVAAGIIGTATLSTVAGGTKPGAPTQNQILLQGMGAQQQYVSGTGYQPATNDYKPSLPNQNTIGWQAPTVTSPQVALAGFNIYLNTGTGWSGAPYASLTLGQAQANYAAYVTNSTVGSVVWPFSTEVNCAWTDFAAANASGYPYGPGPDHYGGGFFLYRVTAIDVNGLEGLPSASHVMRYIYGGLIGTNATAGGAGTVGGQFCGGTFNGTADFANTGGGTTPLGQSKSLKFTSGGAFDLLNPFAAVGGDQWNNNVKWADTLRLSIKAGQAGSVMQFSALVRNPNQPTGDQGVLDINGQQIVVPSSNYGTLINGQWVTLLIPRADLMTDHTLGLLSAWYKMNFQTQKSSGGEVFYSEWDFINRQYP